MQRLTRTENLKFIRETLAGFPNVSEEGVEMIMRLLDILDPPQDGDEDNAEV